MTEDILTGPSVGYTERDLLLADPVELLGREVRHIGTGALGTIIAVSVAAPFKIQVRRHAGQSGQGDPKLDDCSPADLELVTV